MHTSSVEIKEDKFFSMQRAKAHTVKVKPSLKPRLNNGNNLSLQDGPSVHDNSLAAKESVKRTLNEIEDNFRMFKYLPN